MREKRMMATVGIPVGRGTVSVQIPFDTIPTNILEDAVQNQIAKMEWELERMADRLQGLKAIRF
jgi:hypothetical protein